jgi:hypothetical protein
MNAVSSTFQCNNASRSVACECTPQELRGHPLTSDLKYVSSLTNACGNILAHHNTKDINAETVFFYYG